MALTKAGEGTSPAESICSGPSNISHKASIAANKSFNHSSVLSPNNTGSVGNLLLFFNPKTILGELIIKLGS